MKRAQYSASIASFLASTPEKIIGQLVVANEFSLEETQRDAWLEEILILRRLLEGYEGTIYLELSIPRMGRRIDALLLIGPAIFVLEFKVGESRFPAHALDQVCDYALDLKNFHEASHERYVAPILISTAATRCTYRITTTHQDDRLLEPICATVETLRDVIDQVLAFCDGDMIDAATWEAGRYCPTPTIIEAARALYGGHSVEEISRSDAGATNLRETSRTVSEIIESARANREKAVCFVTGVPGAGKTLVGLDIANSHQEDTECYSVFLSGNGPLVTVLREALARDKVARSVAAGEPKLKKSTAMSEVKSFIQNVHHFRDECLLDEDNPPVEHVALFDEAQRAWNKVQTANFMMRKKKQPNFTLSEPEFLISCMNRHSDWAVVVCLVGGGQEINTGEAGISEWLDSLNRSFANWRIYISPRLIDSEYAAGHALAKLEGNPNVVKKKDLHLGVSMRSFRAEHVSRLVKEVLDHEREQASSTLAALVGRYPIVITRELSQAKRWLKRQARGTERYGVVVSSGAERLKPHAIHVRAPMNPVHWFLDPKGDTRSSYYMEDVATEFHIQGLELDWVCVTWDADFRHSGDSWEHWLFRGNRWNHIRKPERQVYLKNAYRVLLTRARQGMVIVVPSGDEKDPTRSPSFYDPTYEYLRRIGFPEL